MCSFHFDENTYTTTETVDSDFVISYTRILKENAVPTLYLPDENKNVKYETLKTLTDNNIKLRREVQNLEEVVKFMRNTVKNEQKMYESVNTNFKNLKKRLHMLKNQRFYNLSLTEQTSILKKVFSPMQIRLLMGKKKVTYWNDDEMSVAYTIRHLSNRRFYIYLTKTLQIPLPAMSSFRRWATLQTNNKNVKIKKREQGSNSESD